MFNFNLRLQFPSFFFLDRYRLFFNLIESVFFFLDRYRFSEILLFFMVESVFISFFLKISLQIPASGIFLVFLIFYFYFISEEKWQCNASLE